MTINTKIVALFVALGLVSLGYSQEDKSEDKKKHDLNTYSIGVRALNLWDQGVYNKDTDFEIDRKGFNGENTNFDLGFDIYLEKQFTPLLGAQLGYRIANMTGANEFEYYENSFNEVYLDVLFYLSNLDVYWMPNRWNFYAKAGAGLGQFEATQYLHADDAIDNEVDDNFAEWHMGLGTNYELGKKWRLELEVCYNTALTDGFDGYDPGAAKGTDIYLTTALGVAYTFGKKEKKAMYSVGYFSDDYLQLTADVEVPEVNTDDFAKKDDVEALEGRVDQLEDDVVKLNDRIDSLDFVSVNVPEEGDLAVYFDFNSSVLLDAAKVELVEVLSTVENKATTKLTLIGFADQVGSDSYNTPLKRRRAQSVQEFLDDIGFKNENMTIELGNAEDLSEDLQFLNRKVIVELK